MKKLINLFQKSLILLLITLSSNIFSQSIFSEYQSFGELHNEFLTNVLNNFEPVEGKDYEQKLSILKDFNSNYVNTLSLSSTDKSALLNIFEENSANVNNVTFYVNSFEKNSGVYNQILELKAKGIIDDFSLTKLNELLKACEERKSLPDMILLVDRLKSKSNSYYNGKNTNKSRILAISLQISHHSLQWWNNNKVKNSQSGQQSVDDNLFYVAPWVAADCVGAVISGAIAAGAQYATTGDVGNWGAVAISAVGGAVVASTGAIGKVLKWFGF